LAPPLSAAKMRCVATSSTHPRYEKSTWLPHGCPTLPVHLLACSGAPLPPSRPPGPHSYTCAPTIPAPPAPSCNESLNLVGVLLRLAPKFVWVQTPAPLVQPIPKPCNLSPSLQPIADLPPPPSLMKGAFSVTHATFILSPLKPVSRHLTTDNRQLKTGFSPLWPPPLSVAKCVASPPPSTHPRYEK
jgi:hypothetical protein